jgi:Zn finger protein HypA/HybF involved in hydrogenase expression
MTVRAGENAQETGDFRCAKCHEKTHVTRGKKIPRCPNCGNDEYDTRTGEPGRKSS